MTPPSAARRHIPITDLGLEYEAIKKELDPLLEKILRSGAYVLGPELAQFEKELASYLTVRCAVGLNSGTDAVTLRASARWDVRPGDEIILPGHVLFLPLSSLFVLLRGQSLSFVYI